MVKKYKIFKIISVCVLFVALGLCVSCRNPGEIKQDPEKDYKEVLNQFNEAGSRAIVEGNQHSWSSKDITQDGHVYGYEYVTGYGGDNIPTKYTFKDLNDDGILELIVANDNYITNIFSLFDNIPKLTYFGWSRSFATLRENNLLLCRDSGGAAIGSLKIGKYQNITSKEFPTNNNAISCDEMLEWDGIPSSFKTQYINITYKNSEGAVTEKRTVENPEFQKLQSAFEEKYPEDNSIKWEHFNYTDG